MFNYYLPFLISIIISSSLAPLLFSLSYVVIILPIAVVGLIEYFLSVSPVLYLDSSIAYLIIFSSCDIVFVVETGILGAGNPAAIALLNVDILSLSVYPPVSTTAPAAVPPPPAGVASPVTGVAVGTPVAGAVVAAEATALDGTLVPLGPPVGGLGDDRSDLALDNKPEAADAIPDTIPPAVEPVGVDPLPEPAGGIETLNPEPAGGADEGGATGAGAEPEGAEGGATGAGAEPEGGATGAGAEPEGGATGAGADEGGAEGGGAEPEGGATGAEPEGGATGAGATGAGAEGGVVIVIEEGTIGAAGVGVIVAVSVSYFTFLLLSNSPDSNFANSLNFISFNDLPPITSSNKS